MCQSLEICNRVCSMGTTNIYTPRGHVIGMLDRDQRTAKIPTYSKSLECSTDLNTTKSSQLIHEEPCRTGNVPNTSKNARFSNRNRKNFLWKSMQRLKQVLVVGTYLLSIVSIPTSLSAPTNIHMAERLNSHPKWINPCGIRKEDKDGLQDSHTEIPRLSDQDLLTQIISQASIALRNANQFKEAFVEQSFNSDSKTFHQLWKDKHYEWLPSLSDIPKNLGENISHCSPSLTSLTMETTLIHIYEQLQKIAVGLEQIVWDQEDEQGPFLKNFTETEFNLRSLLCELQMAIIELGLTQRPDITRDLMGEEFRHLDITSRNLRDWLIYRDYMNALEYAVQAFTHIKNKEC